jgi:hypothetical protein
MGIKNRKYADFKMGQFTFVTSYDKKLETKYSFQKN